MYIFIYFVIISFYVFMLLVLFNYLNKLDIKNYENLFVYYMYIYFKSKYLILFMF